MKKMMKQITAMVMIVAILLTLPVTSMSAKADAVTEEDPKDVYVSFGADLTADEKATVLGLMGITEADLANYSVGQITNQDEKTYLGSYLDSSIIGSRALSSVIVVRKEEGHGINVETKNISYCTPGMYTNALITAGIEDADVIVAGPFSITGTAALVGAMKAYSDLTGEEVSQESMDAAVNELVITSQIAEGADAEDVEELIAYVKARVVQEGLDNEEAISQAIDDGAAEIGITLTEEQKQKIIELMKKINDLDLDIESMKAQASELFDKLEGMGIDKEQAKGFFQKIIDSLKNFFSGLFD